MSRGRWKVEGGQRNDRKVVRLAGCEEKGWERCRASRRLDPLSHRPDRAASDPSAVAFAVFTPVPVCL